jgi:hypothetical protein
MAAQLTLGSAILELSANVAKIQKDLAQASSEVQKFVNKTRSQVDSLKGMAIGFAGLIAAKDQLDKFHAALEMGEAFNKLSQKTGIATEDLSALAYGANLADVSSEDLGTALKKLAVNMAEAAGGGKDATAVFAALGSDVATAVQQMRPTNEVLSLIAEKFAGFEDGPAKAALAVKIFGKSGDALIPFLNNLKEATEEGKKFGTTFTSDFARAAEQFNDNMKRLEEVSKRARVELLNEFLPALTSLQEKLLATARATGSLAGGLASLFTTSGKEADNPGKAVADLEAKLAKLRSERDAFSKMGPIKRLFSTDDIAIVNAQIATLEKRLPGLKALRDLEISKIPSPEEGFSPPGGPKTKAPVIPDSGAADEARRAALARLKAQAEAKEKLIAEARSEASARAEILDAFYQEGLVGEQDFRDRRLAIIDEERSAALAAVDQEIAIRQRAVGMAKRGTTEYESVLKDLEKAQEKRTDLEQGFALASTKAWIDARKGAQDYANTIANLEAQILELRGQSEKAIVLRFDTQNQKLLTLGQVDPEMGKRINELRTLTVDAAVREYSDSLRSLDAQILQIRGDAEAAARILFDIQNSSLERKSSGDPELKRRLDTLRELSAAQAALNARRDEASIVEQNLATAEQRTQNSLRTGQITELDAMLATGEQRRRAVAQLEEIYRAQAAIVDKVGDPKLKADLEAFRVKIDEIAASSNVLSDKIGSIGKDAFGEMLADIVSGKKTAVDAFKDMANRIFTELSSLAAKVAAQKIWQTIMGEGVTGGGMSGGSGGGGGINWAGIATTILGMWAGSSIPAAAGAQANYSDAMIGSSGAGYGDMGGESFDAYSGVSRRATGGLAIAGAPYLVGERRPEIFTPSVSGRVGNDYGNGGNAVTPIVNITVQTPDANSFRASQSQIAAKAGAAMQRAMRRYQ